MNSFHINLEIASSILKIKTMKKLMSLLVVGFVLIAQNTFAQEKATWAEEEAFHTVMSQTWHPIENGNYAPIRERSGELADAAAAWKKADIPAEMKSAKDIEKNLKKLAKETKELDKEIKKGCSDEEIKAEMKELHDIFHTIVGLCSE